MNNSIRASGRDRTLRDRTGTASIPDAAEIASKLTKAQREALLGTHQDSARHAPYHIFRSTKDSRAAWRSVIGLGFVTEEHLGHDLIYQRGRPTGLGGIAPLGLEVRESKRPLPKIHLTQILL